MREKASKGNLKEEDLAPLRKDDEGERERERETTGICRDVPGRGEPYSP